MSARCTREGSGGRRGTSGSWLLGSACGCKSGCRVACATGGWVIACGFCCLRDIWAHVVEACGRMLGVRCFVVWSVQWHMRLAVLGTCGACSVACVRTIVWLLCHV